MNERPIPDAARKDSNAVEMLRVWIADQGLHCSLKVGMYKDSSDIPEERAWGTILGDAARHIANALQSAYGVDAGESINEIRKAFLSELSEPTSDAHGNFVDP